MTSKSGNVIALGLAVGACSSGGDDPTGTVSLSLMDRPVDGVTALYVTITGISVKPAGDGPAFPLPMTTTPLTVDLLELNDENASLMVDEAVVPAGGYNWVDIEVDDSDPTLSYALTTEGGQVEVDVDVPSGSIRLVRRFEVGDNQAVRLIFDWDVRAGLADAVGRNAYLLRPAFRILDADEYGAISGTIAHTIVSSEATCADGMEADPAAGKVVYVFAGDVTPDDMDGNAPEPVTTVDVVFNETTGDFDYRVAVMPGDYTVAFTCQGDEDLDGSSEDLVFLSPAGGSLVTVTAETPVEGIDF